jgi:hypothetical protein
MKALRAKTLAAIACLALSGSSFAYDGRWYVAENLNTHACYRVTSFRPGKDWQNFGPFNTFRMAGAWVWSHRATCQSSPVFR